MSVVPGNLNAIEIEIWKEGKKVADVAAIAKLKSKYNISIRSIHADIGSSKEMDSNLGKVTLKYKKL